MDGTRSALIIAGDRYTDPGLRRLRSPTSDAHALAAVLRDPAIGDFEVRTLLNEPAHEVNLAVEDFFADRQPGDLLLVHFSCHGVKGADGELYFAASNTMLGRLGATAVAAEFVNRQMSRSRSRRVVLLLDCCYAGAFQRGLVARAATEIGIEQQFGGRGRAVITASSSMEYAFEGNELTDTQELAPSVFTSALVDGLQTGEADRDQDGLVSLDELYDYIYEKVRVATPNQTPGKWTFGMEGDLYIARRSRPVTRPAPLPPELQQAIDSPLAGVRAGVVRDLASLLRGKHAGMALAAQLALGRLIDDDSRAVAAAATAALGPPVTATARASATPIDQVAGEAADDSARHSEFGGHRATPQARHDRWAQAEGGPESPAGEKTSRAPRPHRAGRAIRRRPAVLLASAVIAVIGLLTVLIIASVPRPARPARTAGSLRPARLAVRAPHLRWVTRTGDTVESTPAVVAHTVYIGSWDHKVYALNSATGRVRWSYTTNDAVRSSPAVVKGIVYIGSWDGKVYALDASTGRLRWSYTTGGPVSSSPTVLAGTVYIASWDGKVYALDASTGRLRWSYTTGSYVYSKPAVVKGTVYIGSWDRKVYALDASTGRLRWSYTTGGPIYSSPAVADRTVYIGSRDFKVYALDASTGRLRWSYTTGGPVPSSPAVADGIVYADSRDDKVYALDAATGRLRWSYTTVSYGISSPAVAAGSVYIGSTDHKVYALDAATGQVRWSYTTGDGTLYSPAVAGGTVYIGSTDHRIYALGTGPDR